MAVVLRFPDRPPAVSSPGQQAAAPPGTVVILPCVRREPMDMAARMARELEQLQA